MTYLDDDIKSTAINLVVGILVGYVSFLLNRPLVSLFVAIIAFVAVSFVTKRTLKLKKERKWWLSGTFIFALSWLVSWTVLYNL